MLKTIILDWPNSFVLLGPVVPLVTEEFIGVCIESSGLMHKLNRIDTPYSLRQIAEQEAFKLARRTWGKKILKQARISSRQNKKWSSRFSKIELIVKNKDGKSEFILVLVFQRSEYKINEVFQELQKGIDLFVKNQDKWIGVILFQGKLNLST